MCKFLRCSRLFYTFFIDKLATIVKYYEKHPDLNFLPKFLHFRSWKIIFQYLVMYDQKVCLLTTFYVPQGQSNYPQASTYYIYDIIPQTSASYKRCCGYFGWTSNQKQWVWTLLKFTESCLWNLDILKYTIEQVSAFWRLKFQVVTF